VGQGSAVKAHPGGYAPAIQGQGKLIQGKKVRDQGNQGRPGPAPARAQDPETWQALETLKEGLA